MHRNGLFLLFQRGLYDGRAYRDPDLSWRSFDRQRHSLAHDAAHSKRPPDELRPQHVPPVPPLDPSKDCIRECDTYNGTWNSKSEVCVYLEYLQSACYRLSLTADNKAYLDSPPFALAAWLIDREWELETERTGCFYADDWSPFNFGKENFTTIPVEVRYYQDSMIAASYTTRGCSDTELTDAQCMGLTPKEASRVGIAFSFLGLGILVFLIIVDWKGSVCDVDDDNCELLPSRSFGHWRIHSPPWYLIMFVRKSNRNVAKNRDSGLPIPANLTEKPHKVPSLSPHSNRSVQSLWR